MVGEVLNSTNVFLERYIDDINNVEGWGKIKELYGETIFDNEVKISENMKKLYWATLFIAYFKHRNMNKDKIAILIENMNNSDFKKKCKVASSICEENIKDYIGWFKKFSCLAKMFFHLVTIVGNVMPWPKDYNYKPINNELDIVQTKYQYYIGLYGKVDNTGIDKERWIKAFVEGHYL